MKTRDEVLGEQMLLVLPTGPKPIAHEDKLTKRTRKVANKVICGLESDTLGFSITPCR